MIHKEAVKELKNLSHQIYKEWTNDIWLHEEEAETSYCDSLDMAIEALEKQIPKKPYHNGGIGGHSEFICPKCEESYVSYESRLFAYCHNCGQAIDWNDIE